MAFLAGEADLSERLGKEQRPTIGGDQPRNRHAGAFGPPVGHILTVPHGVLLVAAVELRTALAQAEYRPSAVTERDGASGGIELQPLNGVPTPVLDGNRQWSSRNLHTQLRSGEDTSELQSLRHI